MYVTTCPECGDRLLLATATLRSNVEVAEDGFFIGHIGPDTADEVVKCAGCAYRGKLELHETSELTIERLLGALRQCARWSRPYLTRLHGSVYHEHRRKVHTIAITAIDQTAVQQANIKKRATRRKQACTSAMN